MRQFFRVHPKDSFLSELEQVPKVKVQQVTSPVHVDTSERWLPPPLNYVKINADGAITRNRHGGAVAAVCRDHNGAYMGSSTVVFQGMTDLVILETFAYKESLALVEDPGVQNILVASDCQGVVNDG